jgi:hypothetical protein
MTKKSKILDIVFHRMTFAGVFLLYIALVVVDTIFYDPPPTLGISLFIPILIFGLIGFFIDEKRS